MSANLDIRLARQTDPERLANLHKSSIEDPWPQAAFEALLARPQVMALVGIVNSSPEPQGFILIQVIADEAEVLTVCVASEFRRLGLGRLLLAAALEKARVMGAQRVFLEVSEANAGARRLYDRAGFEQVGRRRGYYSSAELCGRASDALVMRKTLVE